MRDQVVAWLEEASADLGVRVVVLTGSGEKGFCTGADLRSSGPGLPRPEGAPDRAAGDAARLIRTGWQRLVAAVLDCEKPVIAAVNATAAGGGMHLALACDLVLAAEEAKFIEVFVRRGIAPDAGGAYLLTRLIGPQKAKELFFFGDDVPAREAERLGLVNKVVPRAQLLDEVGVWADRLAAAPTKAVGVAKYLTNRALDTDRATALWDEAVGQELVTGTEDCREGLAAFAERRPPVFRGW
jgi:2-(1,2-epoxy-1,2-dihydrophenyl)acetyl-CoA isomerase